MPGSHVGDLADRRGHRPHLGDASVSPGSRDHCDRRWIVLRAHADRGSCGCSLRKPRVGDGDGAPRHGQRGAWLRRQRHRLALEAVALWEDVSGTELHEVLRLHDDPARYVRLFEALLQPLQQGGPLSTRKGKGQVDDFVEVPWHPSNANAERLDPHGGVSLRRKAWPRGAAFRRVWAAQCRTLMADEPAANEQVTWS